MVVAALAMIYWEKPLKKVTRPRISLFAFGP